MPKEKIAKTRAEMLAKLKKSGFFKDKDFEAKKVNGKSKIVAKKKKANAPKEEIDVGVELKSVLALIMGIVFLLVFALSEIKSLSGVLGTVDPNTKPWLAIIGALFFLIGLHYVLTRLKIIKPAKAGKKGSAEWKGDASIINAIMLPFRSAKSTIIAFALSVGAFIVPIGVLGLPLAGYMIRTAKQSYGKGTHVLPEWDNWGDLFKKGFVALIIAFVFMLPFIVYSINSVSNAPIPIEDIEKPGAMVSTLWVMLTNDPILLLLILAINYILPMALVFYAVREKFSAAFDFGNLFKKIATVEYVKAWLAIAAYFGLLLFIIGLIFSPLIAGFENLEPGAEGIGIMLAVLSGFFIFQIFAIYLTSISQASAFAAIYKKTE
jgi:hypothetical protein